jgi:hypothetical protein
MTAIEKVAIATRQWQIEQTNYEERGKDKPQPFEEFIKPFLELEKQQIIEAYLDGNYDNGVGRCKEEKYYNAKFKNK